MKICSEITLSILMVTLGFTAGLASEKATTMKDLPAAVQRTVQEQSKGAAILHLSREVEGGKTVYEVEMKVKGRGKDVTIDGSGAVLEVEEEVALESIPGAARAAIKKATGSGQITKVETVTEGNQLAYEAHLRKDGKRSEVKVSGDGRLLPPD
ncbi:MAG: hypothetical protein ABSE93_20220 [Terriglobia bacterium]|jgi:uncharacterized membrane protein YkoI